MPKFSVTCLHDNKIELGYVLVRGSVMISISGCSQCVFTGGPMIAGNALSILAKDQQEGYGQLIDMRNYTDIEK